MKASVVALMMALSVSALNGSIARAQTRFALLVGHNFGSADEVPLKWAEADAIRMKSVLTEIGNIHPDRAILLRRPDSQSVAQAYARLQGAIFEAKHRGESTLLIFYYSGHADERRLHLSTEFLELSAFEKQLATIGADTVVAIIDACRNDQNPRAVAKGATRASSFAWPRPSPDMPKGYVRLSSAARGEVAQESDDLQGSLFTHHLLSGLRGSADANTDGVVTLNEVYGYGYRRTLADSHRDTHGIQHSELQVALAGRGELSLTYPRRAEANLAFAAELHGHLLVVDDATGRIVAELDPPGGTVERLAVPAGRYRIQLRRGRTTWTGLVKAGGGAAFVRANDLRAQSTVAVSTKGASYDPHPWMLSVGTGVGRASVDGFEAVPMVFWGIGVRLAPRWRAYIDGFLGATNNRQDDVWDLQQIEWGAAAGAEWSPWMTSSYHLWIGGRGGVVGVAQSGERSEMSRLMQAGATALQFEVDEVAIGPQVSLPVSFELHPWTQLGFRVSAEPWVRWLPVDSNTAARWGLMMHASAVVRL
ncbi:MAG: caspase family protein [Myxococcota bacterium]